MMKKILLFTVMLLICIPTINAMELNTDYDKTEIWNYKWAYDIKISSDWRFIAIFTKNWSDYRIIINWKESEKYDSIWEIKFSPDWTSYSYKTAKNWKEFIIKDGIKQDEYNSIRVYSYIPNSNEIYIYGNQDWKIKFIFWKKEVELKYPIIDDYIDGIDMVFTKSNSSIVFSKDWKSYTIVTWSNNWDIEIINDWVVISSFNTNQKTYMIQRIVISQNLKKVAIAMGSDWVYETWEWVIFNNWDESTIFDNIIKFDYSDDSNYLLIEAEKDWKKIYLKDREIINPIQINNNYYEHILKTENENKNVDYQLIQSTYTKDEKWNQVRKYDKYDDIGKIYYSSWWINYIFAWKINWKRQMTYNKKWIDNEMYDYISWLQSWYNLEWFAFIGSKWDEKKS